jgi:glycosyltransferase involved in cell wall biosynthesis
MEQAGHKVFRLSDNSDIRFFRPSSLAKLVHVLKSNKVDVLHCHNHKASVYGAFAGTLARTPVVLAQMHGLRRARNIRRKLANLFVFRRASRIIAVAEAVKQDILARNWLVPASKLCILENSVDYDRFADCGTSTQQAKALLGLPADALVFGTVGRLVPTKGLPYLIDAFCTVREQISHAHLVLVGEGYARPEIEQRAAATAHADAIHLLGQRSRIEQLFKGMDVFVLSSVAEGMPRVLLEAMAARLPVVSTRVGGIPDVLNEPSVGFLVPPQDAPSLARTMIQVASMPHQQRAAIGAKAQERVRRCYSHDVIRAKLQQIYEEEYRRHHG